MNKSTCKYNCNISTLKKIKAINLDVIFSFFLKPVIYGALAAKMTKVPRKIAMIEGLGYAFTVQPKDYSKKAMQQSLNFTDETISSINIRVSKALKKSFY